MEVGATCPLEIVILIEAVVLPAEFVAVMVKDFVSKAEYGVPEIAQFTGFRESPPGSVGDEVHEVGAVPEIEGVRVVIAEFTVKVGTALYVRADGATTPLTTSILNDVVVLPAKLVASTLYFVEEERTVGVPVISQVVAFILKPAGMVGEIVQEVGVPPDIVGVSAVIGESNTNESKGVE